MAKTMRKSTNIAPLGVCFYPKRTNADIISIEYRSAIFTTSDAQVLSAKRVAVEIQAKHFTPKGKCFFSLIVLSVSALSEVQFFLHGRFNSRARLTVVCYYDHCSQAQPSMLCNEGDLPMPRRSESRRRLTAYCPRAMRQGPQGYLVVRREY
jgi:hypothetical protein